MKMVKSLLLGSAAGMVAVAGAQAADLPVKAKPVEYVKICSLYGDGFYYIPGTDICIRVGGNVQSDYYYGGANNAGPQIYFGVAGEHDRTSFSSSNAGQWNTRHRGNFQVDTRMQTAYGTLRTFESLHVQNQNGSESFNIARAFIQFAGFTFGRTISFKDTPGTMGDAYFATLIRSDAHVDTGANGINQIAYTWDFGNGITLTGGADERTLKSLSNLSNAAITVGADPVTSREQETVPDPFLAFKINQAWGQFGVSGVARQNSAPYYTGTTPGFAACVGANTGTTFCDHPNDKWGGAVLSGIWINTPWGNGNQDHIGGYANFGIGYGAAAGNNLSSASFFGTGNQVALGWITDGVYTNGGQITQTTAWGVGAGYEHWFSPTFRVVPFATYSKVEYDNTVITSRAFCTGQGISVAANVACDPGYAYLVLGAHADWYPVKQLRLGVEMQYVAVQTAFNDQLVTINKVGSRPAGVYTAKDQGGIVGAFRARKDF